MPREVQAVRAAPRWPADGERFRAGWDDVAAAAALLDALDTRDDGAIDRTLTDVLARAACDGPALLALLVPDEATIAPAEPGRLRLRRSAHERGSDSAAPDLDSAAGVDVVPAVAAALADQIDATVAIGCPLVAPVGTPVGWLVALSGEPCAARLQVILEAVAWVFTLALRRGWEPWRTQPAAIALTPEERSVCREGSGGDPRAGRSGSGPPRRPARAGIAHTRSTRTSSPPSIARGGSRPRHGAQCSPLPTWRSAGPTRPRTRRIRWRRVRRQAITGPRRRR